MLERQVIRYLQSVRARHPLPLQVNLWDGSSIALDDEPSVSIRLNGTAAARHLLRPSLASLGEAFVEGDIDVDGPIDQVIAVAEHLSRGSEDPQVLGRKPSWLTRHSRRTDKRAIEYHYDVSNEFYQLWLDPAMLYSCAYYGTGHEPLAEAQRRKLDLICRKLMLQPGLRMLDIGCGWGALAMHAARHYGVRATGVTLSENQFELARRRVQEAGLADRVDIRLQDYRDVPEVAGYDRISSVGMFEHVGLKNLRGYFDVVQRLLVPGGIALNHGITSADPDNHSVGLGGGDFIERYVFPDGELPHVAMAIHELSAAGLELTDAESLRRHYALTLHAWSEAFEAHLPELTRLAGERRTRIWRVYLAGCARAFEQGWVNIYQLQTVKPDRQPAGALIPVPLTREYLLSAPGADTAAPDGQATRSAG